jgi:sugar transferase (PEP-CTERM system associated)
MIQIFRSIVPVRTWTLLVSEIVLLTSAFVLAATIVLHVDPTVFLLYDGGLGRIASAVVGILLGLHFQDLYSGFHVKSRIVLALQLCLAMGVAFLLQAFLSYTDIGLQLPIAIMLWGSAMAVPAMFLWRVSFSAYAVRIIGRDRLLMVGGSPLLEDLARHIEEHPEKGLEVVGYVDDVLRDRPPSLPGGKILGSLASLNEIVQATRPNRIVVGMIERRQRMPVSDLLDLRFAGLIVEEIGATYERICKRVCIAELRPSQLIFTGELGPRPRSVLYQAVWNSGVALIGIIVALPIMLLTALAVRLSSPGPAVYRQRRVGLNGVPFTLYKFRSMYADAEASTGAVWAAKNDSRVTPVGRIIRNLRLDELPQLFNVLKGEMSIVGPRPERPELAKDLFHIPFYRQRHCIRPGITGWAQINHKYGDTIDDTIRKLEYDLFYIKNMSVGLDTFIILDTIKAMLSSRGSQ